MGCRWGLPLLGFASTGIGVGIPGLAVRPTLEPLSKLGVASPLEYLAKRYSIPTQQALAWSGASLKIFDVAAKWFAVSVLLTLSPVCPIPGESSSQARSRWSPCTAGGLWADALTDFVHPDDMGAIGSNFATVLATPGFHPAVELRARDVGGEWHWLEFVHTNLIDNPVVGGVVINIFAGSNPDWTSSTQTVAI